MTVDAGHKKYAGGIILNVKRNLKMNVKKYLLILVAAVSASCFMFAERSIASTLTVPFQNEVVDVNGTIMVNYSFGTNSMIFCYSNESVNSGGTGNISWNNNGQSENGTLPITLVNDANFQGQLADGSGTLTIQNTLSTPSVINCVYGF